MRLRKRRYCNLPILQGLVTLHTFCRRHLIGFEASVLTTSRNTVSCGLPVTRVRASSCSGFHSLSMVNVTLFIVGLFYQIKVSLQSSFFSHCYLGIFPAFYLQSL